MVDEEVERTLREIRERLRSGENLLPTGAPRRVTGQGAFESPIMPAGERLPTTAEALACVSAYLTTTGRAWDRLPPLASNRSGALARLELWIKRNLKRATRWFTWEQVNFNAAVHYALRDMLQALLAYEREMEKLRAQVDAQTVLLAQNQAEFAQELRNEQRVRLNQLSVEASEATMLLDRTRREIESRLEKVEAGYMNSD